MEPKQKLFNYIKVFVLVVVLSIGATYMFAWTSAPVGVPPICPTDNPACYPPINVSNFPQGKIGRLVLGTTTISTQVSGAQLAVASGTIPTTLGVIKLAPLPASNATLAITGNSLQASTTNNLAVATNLLLQLGGGNVGIGTNAPAAKLDVNGTIAIRGGGPAAGKVLTSDASGVASWGTVSGTGFGAPDYDSGWVSVAGNTSWKCKNNSGTVRDVPSDGSGCDFWASNNTIHKANLELAYLDLNLNGTLDQPMNALISVSVKDKSGRIHNFADGFAAIGGLDVANLYGVFYTDLTSTSVKLWAPAKAVAGPADNEKVILFNSVRIRMWDTF